MPNCSICGSSGATYALPLKKEEGKWVAKPICGKCRKGLFSEARAARKTIAIYGLEGSLREAERRNADAEKFRPFLDAFAKAEKVKADKREVKPVRKNGKKPALVVSSL